MVGIIEAVARGSGGEAELKQAMGILKASDLWGTPFPGAWDVSWEHLGEAAEMWRHVQP